MARAKMTALLALAALAAPAQAQVTLQWQLKEGDKFYLEAIQSQKQVIEVMGQKTPIDNETTNVMSFEVLKKSADGLVLKQTIESVKIKGAGPAAAAQEKVAGQMKGSTFTFTLDPKGRITKVEGVEAYINKLAGDNPLFNQMLKTMFTEDTLKQGFQEIFAFVPDKPVSVGDTWKRDMSMSLGPMGKFIILQDYTYVGSAEGLERVGVIGVFQFEPNKNGGGELPFKVAKGEFKTLESKGDFYFDAKAGRLMRYNYRAKLKGSLTLDVNGMELPMEMELEQETKTRVLDKLPQ